MLIKGSLQMLILNVLAQGPSHGYQIAQHIKQQSRGILDFKEGTLYPTLHGLKRQRLPGVDRSPRKRAHPALLPPDRKRAGAPGDRKAGLAPVCPGG